MPPKKSSAEIDREIQGVLRSSTDRSSLTYHSIGSDADPWPGWLRAYGKACGVYVIRDKSSKSVLYVGSSKAKLYDTITRHFQMWKRKKNWWKGLHGAHHDPGMVYSRGRCEVAVRLVACGKHLDEEGALIHRLSPRDNITQNPEGAPF